MLNMRETLKDNNYKQINLKQKHNSFERIIILLVIAIIILLLKSKDF